MFWTVKRPGRPSNSCTCRFGATGGCKCVVAKSACPHKAKKGEKRTGECRCDEQGRYCCLLEPEHWTALHALQKPVVDFFPTRELLEERQATPNRQMSVPQTPTYPMGSPPPTNGVPGTPINGMNNGYSYPSMQSTSLTPRFGMMDMATPRGSMSSHPDLLSWENGHSLSTPQDINLPPVYESLQAERSSCCQQSTPRIQSIHSPIDLSFSQKNSLQDISLSQPYNARNDSINLPQQPPQISSPPIYEPPAFDFSRMQAQYYANQFPNAICQNCGLSGCTCRNCPPVFQNFMNSSWAQSCGRKHARDVQPAAPVAKKIMLRRDGEFASSSGGEGLHASSSSSSAHHVSAAPPPSSYISQNHAYPLQSAEEVLFGDGQFGDHSFQDLNHPRPPEHHAQSGFEAFDLDPESLLLDTGQHLDISEFLLSDLDRSGHVGQNHHHQSGMSGGESGLNGGGDGGREGIGDDDGGGGGGIEDDGGGGGCCCR